MDENQIVPCVCCGERIRQASDFGLVVKGDERLVIKISDLQINESPIYFICDKCEKRFYR